MKSKFFIAGLTLSMLCGGAFAQDLTGTWQQIDDKSGSPKAIIEIRKESNNTYTGKIGWCIKKYAKKKQVEF